MLRRLTRTRGTTSPARPGAAAPRLLWCAGFVLASWASWGPLAAVSDLSVSTGIHGVVVLGLLAAALLCRPPVARVRVLPRAVFVTTALFLLWSACSLFWTAADDRTAAMGYWVVAAAEVLGVGMLLRRSEPAVGCVRFAQGVVTGTAVLALVAICRFGTAAGRLGDVDVLHPNLIAHWAAIGIMIAAALYTSRETNRLLSGLVGVFLTCVVVSTFSKTVMLALPIALAAFLLMLFRRGTAWFSGVAVAATATVIAVRNGAADYVSGYLAQGQLETLTGRTALWDETWQQIREAKWLGYGFMSFRDQMPQVLNQRLVHAHNELLNTWFTLGIVGVVLVAAVYAVMLREVLHARRNRRDDVAALILAMWVFCLVRGVTEASPTTIVLPLPMVVVLSAWAGCQAADSPVRANAAGRRAA